FAVAELRGAFAPPAVVESRMFPVRRREVGVANNNVAGTEPGSVGKPAPACPGGNQRFGQAQSANCSRGWGDGAAGQARVRAVECEIDFTTGNRIECRLEAGRSGTALAVERRGVESRIESGAAVIRECLGGP